MTEQERKSYAEGMDIVRNKLVAGKQTRAKMETLRTEANRAAVVKQMGGTLAAKCFGIAPAPLSPHLQSLATGAAERARESIHRPHPQARTRSHAQGL